MRVALRRMVGPGGPPPAPPPTARARCCPLQVRAAQSLQGKVVSTNQNKTAVVEVATLQVHPVYQVRAPVAHAACFRLALGCKLHVSRGVRQLVSLLFAGTKLTVHGNA